MSSLIDVPAGLAGVAVTETSLGDVRGTEGFYHYRQYSAVDLAKAKSLEEVWYLLFEGSLPDVTQLAAFRRELAVARPLSQQVRDLLPTLAASDTSPLAAVRTALSLSEQRPTWDLSPAERRADALATAASVPTILTALHRLRDGADPIDPDDDLSYAENYLLMLTGSHPDALSVKALERYLISTIDHGFNASTFTARVIASTGADVAACVVGALGALSGPLHGGAPSRALDTIDAIGTEERIDAWIRSAIANGERIMGFGHSVYRTEDPRSRMLRETLLEIAPDSPRVQVAVKVEQRVTELLAELKPSRPLYTNVEFYAGVVMELCGLPREMFTPTFASSRVIGWTAHVLEQTLGRKIIRPSARYVGTPPPQPIP